ncbi:MAG: glycosyltransferase family 2 protein [Chloroflexi bacterium]|nr:glycosyltransferase family 2 protein [Chloroflexota bacterium]
MAEQGQPPALSVLVLNHNYGRFLGECLDSILAQSFGDYEVIVLDDASSDDSAAVLGAYERDPRVRTVRHDVNRGFTASLVEGTEALSQGEFLAVISADDFAIDHDAFALQVARLREDATLAACICAYTKVGPGHERSVRSPLAGGGVIAGHALVRRQLSDREFGILHSGTVIRAEAYRRAGGYRRDLSNYVDLAMWIALGYVGPVACIDRPLYGYRVHANQFSGSAARRRQVLREGVGVLREAAAAAAAAGIDVSGMAVLRARIADLALADAFAGRRIRGLQRCADALFLEPLPALTSPGWWMALARSVAGGRGWAILAAVRRRLS